MVKDPDSPILDHAKAGANEFIDAGIALHRALKYVETREFEGAIDDLETASDHLDGAVDELRTALELAAEAMAQDGIRTAEEELPEDQEASEEMAARLFERLERKSRLEELFYDDPELWQFLRSAATSSDPFAGYAMFATFLTRVRNAVDGLIHDIERGEDVEHLQNAGWRMLTLYMRTVNLGNMISYLNRETRGGV